VRADRRGQDRRRGVRPHAAVDGEAPADGAATAAAEGEGEGGEAAVPKGSGRTPADYRNGRIERVDPETGHEIIAREGRYGPYVTEVLPPPQ
jgi:hypothetical protein